MDTKTNTRNDPRYLMDRFDPAARLVAWGSAEGTIPMGGWMGMDAEAFVAAVQDEATHSAGEPLKYVEILDAITGDVVLTHRY